MQVKALQKVYASYMFLQKRKMEKQGHKESMTNNENALNWKNSSQQETIVCYRERHAVLPWVCSRVCSLIDYRRRQHVVKTYTYILTSSLIYY